MSNRMEEQEPVEKWLQELLKLDEAEHSMTEKQLKIVQAAADIFAQKGFAASSTSEIAQRAGVAEGTIFRHYKTKKDLLLSIVTPVMAKLIAPFVLRDFNKVLDSKYDSYDQLLRAIIVNRIEFLEKHMQIFKIFIQEIPFHPDLQEQFQKLILSKVLEKLTVSVEKFQRDGSLIGWSPLTIIRLSVSSLIGYVLARTLFGAKDSVNWDDEAEREATITFILKGLAP
ncbi:TetR/AcrR family transcriptional regulator [Paenibacillus harenae]|uniref:AcrR family transcriptional regulator n=2 Tax=Paenibacillus harenae TaxID=306543 RepID=A0ABT9TZX8_PAEHA|nr:TetR/AcrR family transcriptional regulator [Paenibacillus harenae]MDQ0059511.1 AcrR family transcriptional regulator [Paenibacillus harenae]MDQ0112926.1 AcrR family transcriptional regulator [Paenibacillus harenae]